jgi:predicted transcriptional regulator of viral defense system
VASTKSQIKQIIEHERAGKIYFAEDFINVSNNEQVRLALSRLTKEGVIVRLAQGVYVYPKHDPVIGKARPGMEEIATAIANRDHIKIRPTGAYALNQLGLSTQVPMRPVFMTNGSSRKIKVGKNIIEFKNNSSRKMAYSGKISGLVIPALEELGRKNVTAEIIDKISIVLHKENRVVLLEDLKLAPHWIAEIILKILKRKNV